MSRSLNRIVDILNCFSVQRPSFSLTEIAHLTGLDKSTAHRILSSMEASGVLRRDAGSKQYALGAKIMEWGRIAVECIDLHALADPVLRRLNLDTQQTVELYLRDRDRRIRVAGYDSPRPIRLVHPVGFTLPITRGAGGKATLAALPEAEAVALIAADRDLSVMEREGLLADLPATRERGYVVDVTQQMPGALSMAAAVCDRTGMPVATIVISWPSGPHDDEYVVCYADLLVPASRELSRALGAPPDPIFTGEHQPDANCRDSTARRLDLSS